ncbi:undecaprenyl-diphosphate phosphatase [Streptomyces sp. WMMC1477]|uniref:undecaprenyl-diphosphate phosphatase n=1 Tax=Streptomyces sp. WMMC1477 TaxID=3015155 RepID=UPI0022B6CCD8|nr:undecaprenyl-diphosphate phosphatase [Streptomyces sp. WMMC1477]MCZ7434669.1 undecaprenyl-diphosphate phosphatase [Streptomyces sp. WMMC1477]
MTWFESFILGIVQGLTEFLPISSSAHLRLTAVAAGWEDPGAAFTAVAQIGTEAAVLIYFRQDIVRILRAWSRSLVDKSARRDLDARMGWLVIAGSIPIGVLGLTLKDYIEGPFRNLQLIAFSLITLGIVLGVADRTAQRAAERAERGTGRHRATRPVKGLEDLTVRDGILYGCCQALALIPGMSRSGSTITGGLFLGYNRAAAARYSFLLAIPAVLASGLLELTEIGEHGGHVSWGPTILATIVSGLVGYAVIAWFMRFISTRSFLPFVLYRVALGSVLLVLIWMGVLDPYAGGDTSG